MLGQSWVGVYMQFGGVTFWPMNRPRRIENQPRKVGGASFDPRLTRNLRNREMLQLLL